MNKGLIALAVGTFALGIAEFGMMGILGNVAQSIDVTIVQAGNLISLYSLGVAVGAPMLLLFRNSPLKRLMLILSAIIFIGNLLTSLSSSYENAGNAVFTVKTTIKIKIEINFFKTITYGIL